jgi:MFS family permease
MIFTTQKMDLLQAIDEVFLRLLLLGLRILQAICVIPLIGLSSTIISDFYNANIDVPAKANAAVAIAGVCTFYVVISFFPIFFEGARFFTTIAILDVLFMGAFIGLTVKWNDDGTNSCNAFANKYFPDRTLTSRCNLDCKVTRALFAFLVASM